MECNMTRCYMLISTICLMMVNSLIGAEFNEQPLVSNRSTKFEKMSPLRSHFSSRSKGKKRVSRPPTFAIPNRNCSAFQPVQELEEIDIEVKQIQELEKIKDLMVTMGTHGIKSDLKYDEIVHWIKNSAKPLVEADKIIRGQLARIDTFAKLKYQELKELLDQGHFNKESLELGSLKKTSDPVLFLKQLRSVSPRIYQKTSDKLELDRLESLLCEDALNGVVTFEDFSNVTLALEEIEIIEAKLLFLKTSCRELLRQKPRTPSPVRFSPELSEVRIYSASPVEMLNMHGDENKWFKNELSRGPSPEDVMEGRDSEVLMAEEK